MIRPRYLPTLSKSDLALLCRHPYGGAHDPNTFTSSPASDWGTFVATVTEAVHRCARPVGVWSLRVELMADAAAASIPADAEILLIEHPIAYNPRKHTARLISDYREAKTGELVGTADLVYRLADGTVVVRDYKTGRYCQGKDPGSAGQLLSLALAVSLALTFCDQDRMRVEYALFHFADDALRIVPKDVSGFDLVPYETRLVDMLDRLAAGDAFPQPGPHCQLEGYCPIVSSCAVSRATMATVAGDQFTTEIRDHDHAVWLLERVAVASRMVASVKNAVTEYARRKPLRLASGSVYGIHESEAHVIADPDRVVSMLAELGVEVAPTVTLTKGAVEAAIKAAAATGDGAKERREKFKILVDAGAMRIVTTSAVKSKKVKQ